jgi:HSP20 family protein
MGIGKYPYDAIWREMETMKNTMSDMIDNMHSGRYLPAGSIKGMLPALYNEVKIDVREHEDEIIVVADLPGMTKDSVTIEVLNPRALAIRCERKNKIESNNEDYFMRERTYGLIKRIVPLPCDVTNENSTATFKNGVLEVHLKKLITSPAPRIAIEGE